MSILLPHSDDELFVLPFLHKKNSENYEVHVFFLTEDKTAFREGESQKTFACFRNVYAHQLGKLSNVPDGELKKFNHKVLALLENNSFIFESEMLVTPMFEGGHHDHDEAFILGQRLSEKLKIQHKAFSLYNSFHTLFVRVSRIYEGPVKGDVEVIRFSLRDGFRFLNNIFNYRSQKLILAVLFPGLFRTFILKRKIEMMTVTSFNQEVAQPGNNFYNHPWKSRVKRILRIPNV